VSQSRPLRILTDPGTANRLGSQLTRRGFLAASGVSALALLAACTPQGSSTVGGSVRMYTWEEYNNPDNIALFTNQNGVSVSIASFGSNEEMIDGLLSGAADLIVPTGPYVPGLIEAGMIQKLDMDLIPNFANVEPAFRGFAWDLADEWTVVKNWGTTGFVYDNTVITRPLRSWADFIDAAQKEASGRTSLLDDPRDLFGLYFWSRGIDWNTTESVAYDDAERYLMAELAPHVSSFDSMVSTAMNESDQALLQGYNGDVRFGLLESEAASRWTWVLPEPATEIWVDTYAIPASAMSPRAAHAFINFMLTPEVSLAELSWNGYSTGLTNIGMAAQLAGEELLDMVFFDDDALETMTPAVINAMQDRAVTFWDAFKAASGAQTK